MTDRGNSSYSRDHITVSKTFTSSIVKEGFAVCNLLPTSTIKLFILQMRAVRIICRSPPKLHCKSLFVGILILSIFVLNCLPYKGYFFFQGPISHKIRTTVRIRRSFAQCLKYPRQSRHITLVSSERVVSP